MGLEGLFRCRVGFHGVWFQGVRFWGRLLRDLWRKSDCVSPLNPKFVAFAGVCVYCASKIGVVGHVAQSQPWSFRDLWVPWRHRSRRCWSVPWRAILGTLWTTWFCLETCTKPFTIWPALHGSFVQMRASVCIVTHSTALEAHSDEPLVLVCHLDVVAFRTYHLTTSSYRFLKWYLHLNPQKASLVRHKCLAIYFHHTPDTPTDIQPRFLVDEVEGQTIYLDPHRQTHEPD